MIPDLPDALQLLAEADLAAVLLVDPDGLLIQATPSALRLLDAEPGQPLASRLAHPSGAALSDADLPHIRARHERVALSDLAIRRTSGLLQLRWVGAPLPGYPGFTVHVLHEAAPAWHHAALASSQIGVWTWDDRTGQITWSDQAFHITERSMDEPPTLETYLRQVHPEDREELAERVARASVHPQTHASHSHRLLLPDDTVRWVAWTGRYYHDPHEPSLRMVGTVQDITQRKQAEQAARVLQSHLSSLLQNMPGLALQGYDPDGRVIFWNPASEELFGWTEEEAVGQTLDQLIYTEAQAAVFREAIHQLQHGEPALPSEHRFRHKSGKSGWCLSTLFQISGPDEDPLFVCMDVDQTERRRMQERVSQAERLESLGRLAGGIAHDFNNLLTSVLGFTDLALEASEEGGNSEALRHLARVRAAAGRGAALTQQLLAYARQQIIEPRRVDVNQLLHGMAGLLPTMLGDEVMLRVFTTPDLPKIVLDPIQFDQIVLNLALNGADAMPHGGQLTLSTSLHIDSDGARWVRLTVQDTGEGIPEPYHGLIFDPFFTTKAEGRGTGLGLATCYGIVHQSGGQIAFHSEPGVGTTFFVDLPEDREGTAAQGPSPTPKASTVDPQGAPP